jgi:predicted Zn-dependent protease
MRKIIILGLVLLLTCCSRVPFTGRKQMRLIPSSELNALAFQSYRDFLTQNKLSSNTGQVDMIRSVGGRISAAVGDYLKQHEMSNRVSGFEWEFNLVDDEQVNAWAMPGGKVVFYTGIMPFCADEAGVAVVMGHEIAHIIALHGNERMSQALLTEMGGIALAVAVSDQPQQTQDLFMMSYGIGATVGLLLPYSRTHEKEADKIGQYIMAMAGYDPARAIPFWQEMEKAGGGSSSLAFLSTHPSYNTRISGLQSNLPKAMEYFRQQ